MCYSYEKMSRRKGNGLMTALQEIITIDGPSGVGKSTVSKMVANSLGYTYLDTGAMYRAVGLYLVKRGIELKDENEIAGHLPKIRLQLLPAEHIDSDIGVILNGEEVSKEIRLPEMSMVASAVSALGAVRAFLTEQQRFYGEQGKIVAEGRDMGTVVFPLAKWKFYLDARPDVRAKRRCDQLVAKGETVVYSEILRQTNERDKNDSERELAPLCKAKDAISIDTSNSTIEEVVAEILRKVGN